MLGFHVSITDFCCCAFVQIASRYPKSTCLVLKDAVHINEQGLTSVLGILRDLESLQIQKCPLLPAVLPDCICQRTLLSALELKGFSELATIPDSFSNLSNLNDLSIRSMQNLKNLPPGISAFGNLRSLSLSNCRKLRSVAGISGLSSLEMYVYWPHVSPFPCHITSRARSPCRHLFHLLLPVFKYLDR